MSLLDLRSSPTWKLGAVPFSGLENDFPGWFKLFQSACRPLGLDKYLLLDSVAAIKRVAWTKLTAEEKLGMGNIAAEGAEEKVADPIRDQFAPDAVAVLEATTTYGIVSAVMCAWIERSMPQVVLDEDIGDLVGKGNIREHIDRLLERFAPSNPTSKRRLDKEFWALKMHRGDSFGKYVASIKNSASKLELVKVFMTESQKLSVLLDGVSDAYSETRDRLQLDDAMTFVQACKIFRNLAANIEVREREEEANFARAKVEHAYYVGRERAKLERAFYGDGKSDSSPSPDPSRSRGGGGCAKSRSKISCFACGGDHFKRVCPNRHAGSARTQPKPDATAKPCQFCLDEVGRECYHDISSCRRKANKSHANFASAAASADSSLLVPPPTKAGTTRFSTVGCRI
jgi:hypothetical protein